MPESRGAIELLSAFSVDIEPARVMDLHCVTAHRGIAGTDFLIFVLESTLCCCHTVNIFRMHVSVNERLRWNNMVFFSVLRGDSNDTNVTDPGQSTDRIPRHFYGCRRGCP